MRRVVSGHCLGLLGAPLLSLCLLVMSSTSAFAWCNPNRIDNQTPAYDGWYNYVQSQCNVGGTYANFSLYDPYVNDTDSSAWTMILNTSSGHYAQIGYLAKPGSPGPETGFTEYDAGPFTHDYHEFPMPTQWSAEFKVLYGNTPGKITMYANGALKRTDNAGFTPDQGQQFSEVQSWSDQHFGDSSNHLRISNAHIYVCGWGGFAGTGTNQGQNSHWTYSVVSYTEIQVWDLCA